MPDKMNSTKLNFFEISCMANRMYAIDNELHIVYTFNYSAGKLAYISHKSYDEFFICKISCKSLASQ